MQKQAFTFIEIIIVITITVMISVLAATVNNNFKTKTLNTRTTADIITLDAAFTSFAQDNSSLPRPGGNTNFFKEDTSYSEDTTDAYGVYGQITSITLPSKYINFTPLDPATGAYYSYGKMLGKNEFEIAGVIREDGVAKSIVQGNYSAKSGPYNLIREYNGPNFVYDRAHTYFPYNPEGLELNARVTQFTGDVTINGQSATPGQIMSPNDTIMVPEGSEATLYFGDGSKSILGDNSANSTLTLNEMSYPQDNSLVSQIALVLNSGTIWTNATQMGSDSQFTIQSGDTTAAVRGTIFGVQANTTTPSSSPVIEVVSGKVEITKQESSIPAETITPSSPGNANVASIDPAIQQGYGELTSTLKTEVVSYDSGIEGGVDSGIRKVTLKINDVFKNDAEYLKVGNKKIKNTLPTAWSTSTVDEHTFDISGAISEQSSEDILALSFCKGNPSGEDDICTRENRLVVSVGYVATEVDGEVDAGVLAGDIAESPETTTEIGETTTETPPITEITETPPIVDVCEDGTTLNAVGACETIVCTMPAGWTGTTTTINYNATQDVYQTNTGGIYSIKKTSTVSCSGDSAVATIGAVTTETIGCADINTHQYFGDLGECITKNHSNDTEYKLSAYAPYTSNLDLYLSDGIATKDSDKFTVASGGGLNASGNGGYLKYSGLSYNGYEYIIETEVESEALKTNGGKYIFGNVDTGNVGLYILTIGNEIKNIKYNGVTLCANNCNITLNNTWLNIQIKYSNGQNTITIGNKIFVNIDGDILNTTIYVGSKSNKTIQFNGKINYLKIYKKD